MRRTADERIRNTKVGVRSLASNSGASLKPRLQSAAWIPRPWDPCVSLSFGPLQQCLA
jgi:hypothetical protein